MEHDTEKDLFAESAPIPAEDDSPPTVAHEEKPDVAPVMYAGFLRRVAAMIVDFVLIEILHIFFILVGAAAVALGIISGDIELSPLDLILSLTAPIMLLYLFVFCSYFSFFHTKGGQTPGKMLLHIRVMTDTDPPHPLTAPQSFFRAFLFPVSCFFFYFSLLIVLLDKKKRTLHDLMVGSCVVKTR